MLSLDLFEGVTERPMSLNGYSYVEGNPVNWTDPSGQCPNDPWWNDIPGQRCVWLANELHQQYGLSLDLLMQRDVLELEAIYALGNANSTFNESSWAQLLRNGLNLVGGIAVGALQRRGAQAIGASLGDGLLPIGDIIGIGLLCLSALETAVSIGEITKTTTRTRQPENAKKQCTISCTFAGLMPCSTIFTINYVVDNCTKCDQISRNAVCNADPRGQAAIRGGCQGKHHRHNCR